MDVTIISAVAALAGTLAGSTTTLIAGSLQHKRQVKLESDKIASDLRTDAAIEAREILRDIESVSEELSKLHRVHDAQQWYELTGRLRLSCRNLKVKTSILPNPTRSKIAKGVEIFRYSDQIGSDGSYKTHYHNRYTIVRNAAAQIDEELSCFLAHSPEPETGQFFREYSFALQDREEQALEENAMEVHEEREQQAEFLNRHPKARGRLSD